MQRASALTYFLAGLAILALVAGATFGAAQVLGIGDDDVEAGPEVPPGGGEADLAADEVEVTGTAVGVTVEGATLEQIDTPLVVEQGQATLHDVQVDGAPAEVIWEGGRPFDLQGAGGLRPQAVNLFAAPTAITIGFIDELPSQIVPGSYGLRTPVAVGREGLAIAQDAVAFAATDESTITFRGGATTAILPRELDLADEGVVRIEGQLRVRRPDGTVVDATGVVLPDGAFHVTARPVPGGYEVRAILAGPVEVL